MKVWWSGARKMHLSLSMRIILGMAGMVVLTAVASVVIFNIIITNQTRDLVTNFQRISTQIQDYRRQNPVQPQPYLEQARAILNDTTLSPEAQLYRLRGAVRNEGIDPIVIQRILRESGLPVSDIFRQEGWPGPAGGKVNGVEPYPPSTYRLGLGSDPETEDRFISPVLQSFLLGSLVAAACAVLLGMVLSRTVIKPLRILEQASERIADGNYNLEIANEGKDDLGRLAHSFNKMARILRQTEQKRKELVADVAHELRTPLSSIQGYTEVLRDGLVSNRERQTEIYHHILREVHRLGTMVESMRVWVSNEQALENLNIETIPARLDARMVLERFQPQADQKGVSLALEVDDSQGEPHVVTDSDALSHVISNLVDNAIRHTAPGGLVQMSISTPVVLATCRQRVVWFEVKDNGCGIPPEHLPFVFERFYRVDKSRDRNTGGTGLGLAIVRDTVLALGGEVSVESVPEEGTTIRFWLPAASNSTETRKTRLVLSGSKAG